MTMHMHFAGLLLTGCFHEPEAPKTHAPALDGLEAQTAPVIQSEWLAAHFASPTAPQGPPPSGWSEIEASLDPASCGACHPQQYADWQSSWHADAVGPGVLGQYVDWDGTQDGLIAQCSRCHNPLSEQHLRLDGQDNPAAIEGHRELGLTCAGCHVRGHQRHGPPKDEGEAVIDNAPHGGFVPRDEFRDPAFCWGCHDFESTGFSLRDKLLQETTEEWRRTKYAAEGVSCQDCHMPDGRHLWKGVHDPEMVRSAMDVVAKLTEPGSWLDPVEATLTVTNVGAGHRLPTYTTPQITLIMEQVDAQGTAIAGTRREAAVGRYVTPNLKEERFDTRLLPGEAHTQPYKVRRHRKAVALVARVECWPDEAYRRFYEIKLRKPENHPKGAAMLEEARKRSIDSRFTVTEERLAL